MTPRQFARSVFLFLAACAAATLAIGIHMAQPWGDNYAYQDVSGYLGLGAMLLWAVSPLAGLALGVRLLRRSAVASWAWAGGALLIALAGLYAYVDAAFVHLDAQGGLAFVFVPAAQWIAVLCVGAVCALLRAWKPDRVR